MRVKNHKEVPTWCLPALDPVISSSRAAVWVWSQGYAGSSAWDLPPPDTHTDTQIYPAARHRYHTSTSLLHTLETLLFSTNIFIRCFHILYKVLVHNWDSDIKKKHFSKSSKTLTGLIAGLTDRECTKLPRATEITVKYGLKIAGNMRHYIKQKSIKIRKQTETECYSGERHWTWATMIRWPPCCVNRRLTLTMTENSDLQPGARLM